VTDYVNPDVVPQDEPTPEAADVVPGDAESPAESAAHAPAGRNDRKTRQGYVVSDKMDKTVVVEVEDRVKHPLYGKVLRRSSKVKAHDDGNTATLGDRVLIMETRPLSATKRWRVVQILEKAK
jgi:small subunit ribosomal protein S17